MSSAAAVYGNYNGMYYTPSNIRPGKSVVPLAMSPKVLYHINLPGKSGHLDNLDNYVWFQYLYKAITLVKSY